MNDFAIAFLQKQGYPLKIIGNDGYPATLNDIQPLNDGDYMAIYRYPRGFCCHSLDEVKNFIKIRKE